MSFSEEFIKKHKTDNIRGAPLIKLIEDALNKDSSIIYTLPSTFAYDIESLRNLKKNLDELGLHEVKTLNISKGEPAPKNMYYFYNIHQEYIDYSETWVYDYKIADVTTNIEYVSGIAITL